MISDICKVDIIDYALNCSDHLPIYCSLNIEGGTLVTKINECDKSSPQKLHTAINWDRSDKDLFRQRVEMLLITVYHPFWECNHKITGVCNINEHIKQIDVMCEQICNILLEAESVCEHIVYSGDKKQGFWTDKFSRLKKKSIAAHKLWEMCGKPRNGVIYQEKMQTKLQYKLEIKSAKNSTENYRNARIIKNSIDKTSKKFWKDWKTVYNHKIHDSNR